MNLFQGDINAYSMDEIKELSWRRWQDAPYRPIAVVLFDGAGLSALGLRRAGFRTIGVELNPIVHAISRNVLHREISVLGNQSAASQSGCIEADVRSPVVQKLMRYADVIWASPPCQTHSRARTQGAPKAFGEDLLPWSLELPDRFPDAKAVWIENVAQLAFGKPPTWGTIYNAHQFDTPQNRNRMIGGRYPEPEILRPWQKAYKGICPTITASEYKGCATDKRRASKFYGRKLHLWECAYHMDLPVWAQNAIKDTPHEQFGLTEAGWNNECYKAIGNGVPIRMAEAFGKAAIQHIDISKRM